MEIRLIPVLAHAHISNVANALLIIFIETNKMSIKKVYKNVVEINIVTFPKGGRAAEEDYKINRGECKYVR